MVARAAKMPVVPCFGCTRWNGYDEPTQERVWIHTEPSSKRSSGDINWDSRRMRKHDFYLCTTCCILYDRDRIFMERVAQKATAMAKGGE